MNANNNDEFADHNPDLNVFVSTFWGDVLESDDGCKKDKNQCALIQLSYSYDTEDCDYAKTVDTTKIRDDEEPKGQSILRKHIV